MTRGRILIVDDDADSGELTARRLRSTGAHIDFHRGPFGTLGTVRTGNYDLVLLDVNMPGLSGPQLVQLLKSDELDTKVVLYSATDTDQLRVLAEACGACGYLSKTSTKEQLITAVVPLLPESDDGGP